jgi:hypothetical protein
MHHEYQVLASLCVLNHVGVITMVRLDQAGHHHPQLDVLRQTCPGPELNPGLRGESEPLKQLTDCYSEPLQSILMYYTLFIP